jgi:hypothetical protein
VALSHVVVSTTLAVLNGTVTAVCLRCRRRIGDLERIAVGAAPVSLGGPLSMGSGAATKATGPGPSNGELVEAPLTARANDIGRAMAYPTRSAPPHPVSPGNSCS